MYNIDDNFINQIGTAGKEKDVVIIQGKNKIIPQTFKHSFSGEIFTSIMQKIEIEVKNGNLLKENTILQPKYGLKVDNEYKYLDYSNYNVYSSEINYDTNIIKTIAYDNLIKFMIKYEDDKLNITFPTTILGLSQAICNYIGVQLYSTDFFNADLSIEEDLFANLNCTYRDIINYICQATLTTAIIKDNKLYFKKVTETNKKISPKLLKKLKIKQEFGGCNSLVLGRGDLNDNIYSKDDTLIEQDGLQEIRFDNNEILNKRREAVIDNMFEQVKGLKYYSFETKDLGIGIFEPTDFCCMEDLNENTYKVLILNQSITITSGCEGTMSSNVPSTSTTQYQYATDSQKRQTRTEIIVGKQENKITQLAQETTERIEQVQEQTDLNTDEIAKMGSTKTDEGTELEIDASNNPAHIKIWGKTEQATRSGKNKFTRNINSYMVNTPSDTETSKTTVSINDDVVTINPGTTNYSGAYYNNSIDGIAFAGHAVVISFYAKANANKIILAGFDDNRKNFSLTTEWQRYYHIVDSLSNVTLGFYSMGDKSAIPFSIKDIQIEIGTSMTEYEPYGASPSPDYPSRIRNVGDNINVLNTKIGFTNGYVDEEGGLQSAPNNAIFNGYINVSPNAEYTISLNKIVHSLGIAEYVNETFIQKVVKYSSKGFTFTTSKTTTKIRVWVNIDNTATITQSIIDSLDIKLEKGSIATGYSEYGCGSIDYEIENKNKLRFTNCKNYKFITQTINGVTITNNEDGSFTLNGTSTDIISKQLSDTMENLKSGTYYLSRNSSGIISGGSITNILWGDNDNTQERIANLTTEGVRVTPAIDYDKYYLWLYIPTGITFENYVLKPQLEKGKEKTSFIPYQSQDIHFPLSEGQLLHKRDYLAEDGIHQNMKTIVLTGNENWLYSRGSNGLNRFEFSINDIFTNTANILSTHFKYKLANEYNCIFCSNLKQLYIVIDFTTVDEFKSYLAEQYANGTPVIVEYELEEEIVTPLTPEQQKELDSIETFKGTNYIYCIDEIIPEKIELEYYPNTPYNDTLINKDTFDKVTSDMSAQINIKANEVETSVKESTTASILTLLNNGYLTAEQVNALVNGNAEDIATVKKQLTQTVTSSQMQIEIAKAIEGGVSYLKNTLFTIDENGMAIATSEDEFNALYNNKGMYLYSFEQLIAKFDVSGATIEGNLILKGELTTPNLRMMNVSVSGVSHTHIHWIGG